MSKTIWTKEYAKFIKKLKQARLKADRRIKGIKGALTTGGENQQRTLMQEMLRNVGAKIQPVNVEAQRKLFINRVNLFLSISSIGKS